ncbi:glyoxalase/bleomycin resistance/dioxygenase family protein [Brevibacillus fluminis]|uniref:Glyoxalase/bleomycin resistance/dioxygenase family protein n=1 Tax=Brevibacillus fluminis TaxID=511487 RepID=A0A3M8DG78_9BACL|nr:glyoxalase/bleomycin resistance/dioxygenase family protein [Brevibacillus fluminis]RNB87008.1 glyoxalase/bleomycin resistance/dioxygenase family protein [Brevibacillus fluminis]
MITHFSGLKLQTLSIQGVRQVYAERLGFPIIAQTGQDITFAITPHASLTFKEVHEPLAPVHFAFQVPYEQFHESVKWLKQSGLFIAAWPDGREIDDENGRLNLYFRDGDGNLLEIIAHEYVADGVLVPHTPLNILYLREVGCPVASVPVFRNWLRSHLQLKTLRDGDFFNFVIGGTAHVVANWHHRRWLPIDMKAVPPKIEIAFGTPSLSFLHELQERFYLHSIPFHASDDSLSFHHEGYSFSIHHTPGFAADIPLRLQLP